MNGNKGKGSRASVGVIATVCASLLATAVTAAPFPRFGAPGHPGFVPLGHGPGVFVPHGPRHGRIWHPAEALVVLGATAVTLSILDHGTERQRLLHESAQVHALAAPVGERIVWEDGTAYGSVTTLRRGADSAGRACREYRQTVTIGDSTEVAYGTACRRSDGSWQIVR